LLPPQPGQALAHATGAVKHGRQQDIRVAVVVLLEGFGQMEKMLA
jgi:hypothetical protein